MLFSQQNTCELHKNMVLLIAWRISAYGDFWGEIKNIKNNA